MEHVHLAGKIGQLTGNHFMTIIKSHERLHELGRLMLWEGAQDCVIERIANT